MVGKLKTWEVMYLKQTIFLGFGATAEATGDLWVFTFNYSHSTHEITLHLETNTSSTQPVINEVILIALVALFVTVIAIESKYWLGRKEKGPARQLGTN
jgi:hypothetical protein